MYTFISAERFNLSKKENDRRTETLRKNLDNRGLSYDDVVGMYDGVEEKSFRVWNFPEAEALALASHYAQESILVVDNDDNATVIFSDGNHRELLGKLREVSEVEARKHAGYSIIDGKYFIA